jgi:hypothetical protein
LTPRKENVLVGVDKERKNPWACIAGFSIAIVTENLNSARFAAEQTSLRWYAPELLEEQNMEHQNLTKKSDVFSFAMMTIQVRRR